MNKSSTFLDMPLSEGMRKTITSIGYTVPTPIQEQSIPELMAGHDLLGQAQTGTGKTAAFSIPLVELVNEKEQHIQALVVCPTRELCLQVCQEIKRLSIHKASLDVVALYGGQAIDQQFRLLKSGMPQIVVATPGRLFDHLRRKSVELSRVRMIVLDEADEMLDMGFRPEIEQIFEMLPEQNQRIFFSATMAKAIKDLACSYLKEPKIIKMESKTLTVSTITQSYLRVRGREKIDLLCRMLDIKDPKLAVVFCNAKSTVDEIVDEIQNRGFEAGVLHGDLSQSQRDRVMVKFKAGLIRVLVATDVAARGLDIDDVELVFNYHLPHDPEDYVHRIGRTGRAGRLGCAISLVEPRDNSRLRRISQFAKVEIAEEHPPTVADVKAAKVANLFAQVKDALASKTISEYRSLLQKQKIAVEDIAAGMLQMALQKFDVKVSDDAVFEGLRERKYSGYTPENRQRGRNEREPGGPSRRRSFSDESYESRPRRNGQTPYRERRHETKLPFMDVAGGGGRDARSPMARNMRANDGEVRGRPFNRTDRPSERSERPERRGFGGRFETDRAPSFANKRGGRDYAGPSDRRDAPPPRDGRPAGFSRDGRRDSFGPAEGGARGAKPKFLDKKKPKKSPAKRK